MKTSGATAVGFQRALGPASARLSACYRNALPLLAGPREGSGLLRIETDDVGVITRVRLEGAFRSDLSACITKAALGGRVPNVDTGTASAEIPLAYRPR
jgi:hypothetical protein